jgi:hypothetical protein
VAAGAALCQLWFYADRSFATGYQFKIAICNAAQVTVNRPLEFRMDLFPTSLWVEHKVEVAVRNTDGTLFTIWCGLYNFYTNTNY